MATKIDHEKLERKSWGELTQAAVLPSAAICLPLEA
jgi:hypothetical protein